MSRRSTRKQPPRSKAARPAPARPAGPAAGEAHPLTCGRRAGVACLLGLLCFLVYLSNLRPMATQDTIPARLLPFSILREGNFDLDEFHWIFRSRYKPYFLKQARSGRHLSAYSIGVPMLVTPLYLPALWLVRHYQIEDDDVRFRLLVLVMERVSAATLASASVMLLFLILLRMTPVGMAVGISLAYAFGTSIWSIGSQTLLQHGGAAFALAAMSFFLVAPATWRSAAAAGACAAFAVLARPTMVVFALLALAFVWRERRRHFLAFLSVPIAGVVFLVVYNAHVGGLLKGGYHGLHFAVPRLQRLVGLLFSPSRGLFIYTPAALLALPAVAARNASVPRLVRYLPIGIGGYLLFYSTWRGWWGGDCYGPRFLTDALPAIALCAAPAAARMWQGGAARRFLVAVLVAWGIMVQVIGTYCDNNSWNRAPIGPWRPIGQRVWEWNDPQILRAARVGWRGGRLAPLLWQALTDSRSALLRPIAPEDFAGEIAVEEPLPLRYRAGEEPELRLRLTNHGSTGWPAFKDYGPWHCKLYYRWRRGGKKLWLSGGMSLRKNLYPGESTHLRRRIRVPPAPGDYELELVVRQVTEPGVPANRGPTLRLPVRVK